MAVQMVKAIVYDAVSLAEVMGVSLRHIRRMDACGLLPKGVRFGRAKRWRCDEIHAWIAAGAPDRLTLERMKEKAGEN